MMLISELLKDVVGCLLSFCVESESLRFDNVVASLCEGY